MTKKEAKTFILGLTEGWDIDSLIETIVFKQQVQPLFFWDGSIEFYPFVKRRFIVMKIVHSRSPGAEFTSPEPVFPYSKSLAFAVRIMQKLHISLKPQDGCWKATSGRMFVVNKSAPLAVCQLAILLNL